MFLFFIIKRRAENKINFVKISGVIRIISKNIDLKVEFNAAKSLSLSPEMITIYKASRNIASKNK